MNLELPMMSSRSRSDSSASRSERAEAGVSLVGMISVLLILAVMAVFAMRSTPTVMSPRASPANQSSPDAMSRIPTSGSSLATVAACRADYLTLAMALAAYRSIDGVSPPAGRTWATTGSAALIHNWPKLSGFAFSWNGTLLSVVPIAGTASHGSLGTSTPPTGCYAK